ncbi:MAG: hypothetical protein E7423_00215 [Ruminococcaceae bacterium]|nr:hypothetical protein [Oscillospiraceae bacterium]
MYNRYVRACGPPPPCPPPDTGPKPPGILPGGLRLPKIDADTILLLVMVYFLVRDPDDRGSDTLLIIAALFLLGL